MDENQQPPSPYRVIVTTKGSLYDGLTLEDEMIRNAIKPHASDFKGKVLNDGVTSRWSDEAGVPTRYLYLTNPLDFGLLEKLLRKIPVVADVKKDF